MVSKNITDVISQGNRTIITTPKVLEVAKQYFSCGDIQGVELENQGGDGSAGSHWERTVLFNEMFDGRSDLVVTDDGRQPPTSNRTPIPVEDVRFIKSK